MVHYHLQPTHEDWEILAYPKALGTARVALGVKIWVLGECIWRLYVQGYNRRDLGTI